MALIRNIFELVSQADSYGWFVFFMILFVMMGFVVYMGMNFLFTKIIHKK